MIETFRSTVLAAGLMAGASFPAALAEPGPGYPAGPMNPAMHDAYHHGGPHHAGQPCGGDQRGSRHAGRSFGLIRSLDLSDEQRTRIRKIEGDLRRATWDAVGKVHDEKEKLRNLYDAGPRDAKAIGAAYGAMFGYQRQIIEASVEALNRAEAMLTDTQRERLKQLRRGAGPGAMRPGTGPGPQGAGPMRGPGGGPGPMGGPHMGGPGPYGPPQ